MLKKSGIRLLTRSARNGAHAFPITYRAATGGSGPTGPFFQHPAKRVLIVAVTTGYQTRSLVKAAERAAEVAAAADPVACVGRGDRTAYIALPVQEQVALV